MAKFRCPICERTVKDLNGHIARFHPEDTILGKKSINVPKITHQDNRKQEINEKNKIIVVDGQNVANYGKKSKPAYRNLFLIFKSLRRRGYSPKIVVSAALKYKIDNPVKLNKMFDRAIAIEAPAGENDDLTILELASRNDAKIITNDRYLDHKDFFPDRISETVRFMIVNGEVEFNPPL